MNQKFYHLFIAMVVVLAFSCKTAQNQANSIPPATGTQESVHLDNRDKSDSLFAMIRRTPCYGQCPTYVINIYKSGFVHYEGIRFVEKTGMFTTRITKEQMNSLVEKAKAINYFSLKDEYDTPVTDIPSTYTYLSADGKTKRIHSRAGVPPELREYEKLFDSIFEKATWVPVQ